MKKYFLIALLAASTIAVAQEKRFVIHGEMSSPQLRYSEEFVSEVQLEQTIDGQPVTIVTAKVENNRFTLEGIAPDMPIIGYIKGFDNGSIQVFLEEGEINVGPFDAAFPVGAEISGTPANDTYQAFLDINDKCIEESKARMKATKEQIPAEHRDNLEIELQYTSPTFYVNNLHFKVAIMDFVYNNLDSPVILYIIKYSMAPAFETEMVQSMLNALPESLHGHSMYKELMNEILAANLKVGAQAPDITGRTPDGKELSLSDFKGKYVFLDFWASWCAPCRREIPHLKEVLAYSEKSDNLVVLSYSIDSKEKDWLACIEKNGLTHQNWVHISTLKGWNSEGVKLFNVKGVPYTVLVDPDGKVVQFELRGEEMVKKLKGIVDGAGK